LNSKHEVDSVVTATVEILGILTEIGPNEYAAGDPSYNVD